MAANWPRVRAARRSIAWEALTRLRRRVTEASGQAVRFLVGMPKRRTPAFSQHEALVQYIREGGTYEEYMEEVIARAPRGSLGR
jgi:hypothetical protein